MMGTGRQRAGTERQRAGTGRQRAGTERQKVGKRGEDEACSFLRNLGHIILERNWRSSHLEIDIITENADGIHFVEVKTRNAPYMARPEDNVGTVKQRRLVKAAKKFIDRKGVMAVKGAEIFFDVIAVVFSEGKPEIKYFPQAFIPIFV